MPIFSTYSFCPRVNGYVVESYDPSRVNLTEFIPINHEQKYFISKKWKFFWKKIRLEKYSKWNEK